jgi:hypothetical protein
VAVRVQQLLAVLAAVREQAVTLVVVWALVVALAQSPPLLVLEEQKLLLTEGWNRDCY